MSGTVHEESGGPAVDLETEPLTDFDAAGEDWRGLAELSGNLFATWEWMSAWWRHFGRDRSRLLVACRDRSGELVAIPPLYLARTRPLRVVRFLGHGPGDHLGPICAPENRPAAIRALHRMLAERPWRWQAMLAERLPSDEGWASLVGGREIKHDKSPVLAIEGPTRNEFLASRSANFRAQVGKRERKLIREHSVRYRLADDPGHLAEDLDTLFRLHEARWGPAEEGGLHGDRQPFHREFAALALERGWLRLWFLEAGGQPVAAWYGFRFGGPTGPPRPVATPRGITRGSASCSSATPSGRRSTTAWRSTGTCAAATSTRTASRRATAVSTLSCSLEVPPVEPRLAPSPRLRPSPGELASA